MDEAEKVREQYQAAISVMLADEFGVDMAPIACGNLTHVAEAIRTSMDEAQRRRERALEKQLLEASAGWQSATQTRCRRCLTRVLGTTLAMRMMERTLQDRAAPMCSGAGPLHAVSSLVMQANVSGARKTTQKRETR